MITAKTLSRPSAVFTVALALAAQQHRPAVEPIQPSDLQADIAFLTSDELKGRNSGSAEDLIATDYIASEFLRLGLKPAGDHGTFFQNMEINTAQVDREHTTFISTIAGIKHTYTINKDFRWSRQSLCPAAACGGIVFAGYGINAPEYEHNNFSRVDVKGKIIVVLAREPQANDPQSKFMGAWDTYHAFNWEKLEEARNRGAAGHLYHVRSGLEIQTPYGLCKLGLRDQATRVSNQVLQNHSFQ